MPKGIEPMENPYALEARHDTARTSVNALCFASSAYASAIAETATAPKTITRIA
ncbi:MAG TPA: hypothetical protein VGH46_08495 [Gaiellaceae bacterium]|jgi:hypothetical protein